MDSARLNVIDWHGWFFHLYNFAVNAGHPVEKATDWAESRIRAIHNVCAGACMSEAERDAERQRFDDEAAEVEREIAEDYKSTRRGRELAELAKRRETHQYWSELYDERGVVV